MCLSGPTRSLGGTRTSLYLRRGTAALLSVTERPSVTSNSFEDVGRVVMPEMVDQSEPRDTGPVSKLRRPSGAIGPTPGNEPSASRRRRYLRVIGSSDWGWVEQPSRGTAVQVSNFITRM